MTAIDTVLWAMYKTWSCQFKCANEWMCASVTVISTNISFDASSSRKLLNKMFEVSACVIMIYNSLELMQNLMLNSFFKLYMWSPSLTHHIFQLFGCMLWSSSACLMSPFRMASSCGPVQGSEGGSVYSPFMSAHDIMLVHSSAGSLGRYLGEITHAKRGCPVFPSSGYM